MNDILNHKVQNISRKDWVSVLDLKLTFYRDRITIDVKVYQKQCGYTLTSRNR